MRSVTTREPEWTEQDAAWLSALALYRSWLCPCGCGFLESDTTSLEGKGPDFQTDRTLCRARWVLVQQQRVLAQSFGDEGDKKAPARLWRISMQKR